MLPNVVSIIGRLIKTKTSVVRRQFLFFARHSGLAPNPGGPLAAGLAKLISQVAHHP
jgi:hypothetical protein